MANIARLIAPTLMLGATPIAAQSVTYEEVLDWARESQPVIEARLAMIEAREQAARAAGELPDPRFTAGMLNLPVNGPEAFDPTGQMMTMFQFGAEQEIPNLAERRARKGIATAEVGQASAELARSDQLLRLAAGESWVALAYSQRRLDAATTSLDELQRLVPVATSAVASGSARPAQSLEIRRALLQLEDARTTIAAERDVAKVQLARFQVVDSPVATGALPTPDVEPERLRTALANNPQLLLAAAQVGRNQAAADLARSDRKPDFGIGLRYGVRDREYGDLFSVMGSITLPIFAGKRQEPRIRAAEAELAAARAERADLVRRLEAEFEADLAAWRSAHEQWQRARDELLPLARNRAELETASYAAGRAELTDVIEAQTALALLELDILAREYAAVAAATRLQLTYGEHTR